MKAKLTTSKDFFKDLQEEVECLNKESTLFKPNATKVEEKLKSDLDEIEAEILKTHEVE